MNLTDWVVGNLKPYKLALNSPTRIGSFLPTIYGCVLPTLTIVYFLLNCKVLIPYLVLTKPVVRLV